MKYHPQLPENLEIARWIEESQVMSACWTLVIVWLTDWLTEWCLWRYCCRHANNLASMCGRFNEIARRSHSANRIFQCERRVEVLSGWLQQSPEYFFTFFRQKLAFYLRWIKMISEWCVYRFWLYQYRSFFYQNFQCSEPGLWYCCSCDCYLLFFS
jgi:hypothetical protein